ncbi:unnamed protein product [Arabidopsis arenosa]|uniref:Peptidase M24 C-terminal domain-containing protein n=1 Tax=Arabidopsis arenosa TaxID=38785 RepID=A0A8S1ZSQ5_ARAAE|nr:unnamed protein product [Arabidopsis arenosa]
MVARTPQKQRKVAMVVPPLNSDLLKETINKVDKCMERLQELQFTIAGGTKVVSGVNLSPRSTRIYLRTSLRCKQETLRIKSATNKKSPVGKFPASSPGDWRKMSLPAMLLGETVTKILQASQSALMDMYSKCGSIEDAWKIFESTEEVDEVSMTLILVGLAQNGSEEEAIQFFIRMLQAGVEIDANVVSAVLGVSFVDKLFGSRQATAFFTFARHGHGLTALEIYEEMISQDVKPTDVTFLSLLHACSHVGLLDKGQELLNDMQDVYGIEPRTEHYTCIIDMLGRAGHMKEAKSFIDSLPVKPDCKMWQALLGACSFRGDTEIEKYAAEQLLQTAPDSSAAHILMANIYSSREKWKERAKTIKRMKAMGVTKGTGISWIEIEHKTHCFVVEDKMHPQEEAIYDVLSGLFPVMVDEGYRPDKRYSTSQRFIPSCREKSRDDPLSSSSPYSILGIDPSCSSSELKAAFRAKVCIQESLICTVLMFWLLVEELVLTLEQFFFYADAAEKLKEVIAKKNHELVYLGPSISHPQDLHCTRPKPPSKRIRIHDLKYAGLDRLTKPNSFLDNSNVTAEVKDHLKNAGTELRPYDSILQGIDRTPADILPIPLVWLLTSLLLELASRHIVNTHSVSDMLSFPQTTPAGYYEGHAFGIRIENLLHVRDAETPNRFGGATYLLGFEKLTFFPIQTKIVDASLLSDTEVDWLNTYHAEVWDKQQLFEPGNISLTGFTMNGRFFYYSAVALEQHKTVSQTMIKPTKCFANLDLILED